jgi:hypothetical protein
MSSCATNDAYACSRCYTPESRYEFNIYLDAYHFIAHDDVPTNQGRPSRNHPELPGLGPAVLFYVRVQSALGVGTCLMVFNNVGAIPFGGGGGGGEPGQSASWLPTRIWPLASSCLALGAFFLFANRQFFINCHSKFIFAPNKC